MPTPPMTHETMAETVRAIREHGSVGAAARALGVPETTMRHRAKVARAAGMDLDPGIRDAMAAVNTGMVPSLAWIKTAATKDAPGYSVMLRPDRAPEDFTTLILAALDGYEAPTLPPPAAVADAALLTLYGLFDVHLGLLSWGRETGDRYDIAEAVRVATAGMADLIARSPPAETAVLLIGGDFTHADNEDAETPTSRHRLDTDGRFYKTADAALSLLLSLIDLARQRHPRVVVRVLPGNHDPHAAKWLTIAAAHLHRTSPGVDVVEDPGEYFFIRHGSTLIASHHGHRRKMQDLAGAIPALRPAEWGASLWRYLFTGHVHHERIVLEVNGVLCRSMSAVTARDSYAAGMAFTAGRSMSALTFHDKFGLRREERSPILPAEA